MFRPFLFPPSQHFKVEHILQNSLSLEVRFGFIRFPPLSCLPWRLPHRFASLGPTDSTCRGNTLGPNDKPLAPFEHIEGKGGRYRLGWLFPWFGYTPKLAVSASGEMVATRSDGSKVRPDVVPAKRVPPRPVPPPPVVCCAVSRYSLSEIVRLELFVQPPRTSDRHTLYHDGAKGGGGRFRGLSYVILLYCRRA